jgi:heat shock protein HslJ
LHQVVTLLTVVLLGVSAAASQGGRGAAATVGVAEGLLGAAVVLEIGPRTVPCDDVVPRRCFEARPVGESEWRVFDAELDGYQHRDAHAAVLLVRPVAVTGEDAAPTTYQVVHVLAELPLGGARWTLERYGEVAGLHDPLEHVEVGFVVVSGGRHIEGSAGCNDFSGPIELAGDRVRIGPLVTTERSCDADVMRQEALVLAALQQASRVTFYRDAVAFAGDELRVRFGARLAAGRLTWTQGPDDPELQRFADRVRGAADEGERWTRDPIRVALALIDSRGAPRVDVSRRDDRGEAPTSTLVVVDEDGFLDDSVRGVRSQVLLAPAPDGSWRVLAVTVVTRCWRDDRQLIGPGETCP